MEAKMENLRIELLGCFICGGTLKCPYCKGKGETSKKLFSKNIQCKKCDGTGGCPLCLGNRKLWVEKKLKKWVPDDHKEEYMQLIRKTVKLRRNFDHLHQKYEDIRSLEEFSRDKRYSKSVNRKNVRRISSIITITLEMSYKIIRDYDEYLKDFK
jgi:hypothetical protein